MEKVAGAQLEQVKTTTGFVGQKISMQLVGEPHLGSRTTETGKLKAVVWPLAEAVPLTQVVPKGKQKPDG